MDILLVKISIMLVPGLLAIVLHEVAHGYIAERLGDPTARMLGRLTLNPFKHIDPFGLVVLFLVGFGWARPVPVNVLNFKRPRQDMVWVALAGPVTNLILAGLSALFLRLLLLMPLGASQPGGFVSSLAEPLILMAGFSLYINLLLAALNLLPVPPLDGGRVISGVLPEAQARWLARIEPFGFFILILLVFVTPLWDKALLPAVSFAAHWLAGPQAAAIQHFVPLAGS
ncbi:peptidase [Syntrophotalea acetylenivorans]|uniref:Peptidase n=1 Tax=Syntrophotalea acetylenivorans TaxID=1842532 RepID=A0A1L3GL86_9BACT|nr:site-2 protease family protein [Syntrophotalea acetylenivorans]APG26684.1 peptidase [Syntrophotalea acetylenivorans]